MAKRLSLVLPPSYMRWLVNINHNPSRQNVGSAYIFDILNRTVYFRSVFQNIVKQKLQYRYKDFIPTVLSYKTFAKK